ncbi:serine/threonine-protein kinase H1 homolog isoform X2 [Salmo salar]|uniref:Serine/threonine-protein kinase H1 homolog isoform X2 n=1 Tax=Salmo salar TaxID=8030 RepID=A0ABM3D2R4_SALSA|nr:serine/threonine-protein kinase H1 homolog isoform X2 [Salmo salar]
MGCRTSKVLPEPPGDVQLDLVKKVEPPKTDIYKHFIRDDGSGSKMGGEKTGSLSPQAQAAFPAARAPPDTGQPEASDPRRNKVAKYRAKFDPRVTAKYDIKALIGRGSFSRVVRVEHKSTRQPYAIKMIETRYREGREVCESELCVLRRVRHTNIIQLMEVFETAERVYMVMELATGGELFDRIIARGSFTERDATRVLQMVLDGVKYLHTLGITHRDLKPENLLYYHPGADSKIMITDFGLASTRKKGDECLMKTTCGTPEYIAPEILVRKPYTNAVDMWALGVISYILLSGTMPFEDDNRMRLYRQILKGKYSFSGEFIFEINQIKTELCGIWLNEDMDNIQLAGFSVHQQDRTATSGKTRGGGLCLFVNNSCCAISNIKDVSTLFTKRVFIHIFRSCLFTTTN